MRNPQVRLTVAEAVGLYPSSATTTVPALRTALAQETDESVKEAIQNSLRALERRRPRRTGRWTGEEARRLYAPPQSDSVVHCVTELLRDPYDVKLAEYIFGTADACVISQRVESFCRDRLGRGVSACELFTQSIGAVFVLRLQSGERVVLKFYALQSAASDRGNAPRARRRYTVQAELAKVGIACADVIHTPLACHGGCRRRGWVLGRDASGGRAGRGGATFDGRGPLRACSSGGRVPGHADASGRSHACPTLAGSA
jgi:hypothetical protein